MKKQNGFSQIVIMVVMLILAIALPITANLVKKVQDNRSSAAVEYCSTQFATRCVSGKLQSCKFETEVTPAKLIWTSSSTICSEEACTSKGGSCVTSYTGMSSGITCSGSTGGTNGGTTNTGLPCYSSKVCCVPNSPGNTSGSAGTGTGAEACVAKSGACQTTSNKTMPTVGSACTVNGKTGTSQANLCVGQYNSGYRCCVPGSTPDPAPAVPVAPTGCGANGVRRCNGKGTLQICNGTDWISQPVAAICEGTKAYNCDNNIIVTNYADCAANGQTCLTGHCCTPNNSCASSTLIGQTCTNNCGKAVSGTKVAPVAPTPTPTQIACGDNELSGSNHADEIDKDFEMGRNSGHFTFTWRLYAVPDRVQVFYENTLLFDKTDGNSDYKSVVLSYGPGTSTKIHVHIIPDVTAPLWYYKISCAVPGITPTPTPVCTAGAKQCSGTNAQICKTDGTGWTSTACGTIGCNANTKVCNVCTPGTQKCSTTTNKYLTCSTSGIWSTATTTCASGKICTNGDVGTGVCKDPAYVAPKFNILFAISGVKAVNPCFGDLKFKVAVSKESLANQISSDVTAVSVGTTNHLGDAIFKISNFALSNNYALTDKMKLSIGGKKSLVTIYGKNNQDIGFPAMNTSQILVSDLVTNKTLTLYEYPILNGDIASEGKPGTPDNVVNGFDFALMKKQVTEKAACNAGENLAADLNGDCRVNSSDLQILKNAMGEQYAQKTF